MSDSDHLLTFDQLLSSVIDDCKSSPASIKRDFRGDLSFENLINSAVSTLQNWSKLNEFIELIEMRVKRKDDTAANASRKEGNSYYMKSDQKMALMKYNESIKLSPHPPMEDVSDNKQNTSYQELSFSYGNRSAVLFQMELYDEACTDIRRAVSLGYSPQKQKLSLRYFKSLIYLHLKEHPQSSIASSVFATACEKTETDLDCTLDDEQRKQITDHKFEMKATINKTVGPKYIEVPVPVLEAQNPFLPGLSNKVEVTADVKKGRYLIAEEDIYPGTLLVTDPGFVAASLDSKHAGNYCSACSKPCKLICVPCHQCTSVVFCNERCRDEAFKSYHHYECSLVPLFDTLEFETKSYLTLRIIASLGYSKLHDYVKIFEKEEEVKEPSMAKRGFSPEGVYDSKSYRTVYYLLHHKEKRDTKDLFVKSCMAVVMTFILKKYTAFFGNENLSSELSVNDVHFNECEMLIAKLILRHLMSMSVNASSSYSCEESSGSRKVDIIGDNLLCLFSLFGHSCNPNIFLSDSHTVRSIAFIPKGTELNITFSMPFSMASKQVRQGFLRQYYFNCECIACVEDWQTKNWNLKDAISNIRVKCMFGCKNGTLNECTPRCSVCSKGFKRENSLYSETYLKYINRIIHGSTSEDSNSIKRDMALTTENVFTELVSQIESVISFQRSGTFSKPLRVVKEVAYDVFKGIYLFDTYGDCPNNYMLCTMRDLLIKFYTSSSPVTFQ